MTSIETKYKAMRAAYLEMSRIHRREKKELLKEIQRRDQIIRDGNIQQEKHYLNELTELSKRNLDLFHENMMLKEKLNGKSK